jgi:hypothetical protein
MEHFDTSPMAFLFDQKDATPDLKPVELFGPAISEAFRTLLTNWHLPELELVAK